MKSGAAQQIVDVVEVGKTVELDKEPRGGTASVERVLRCQDLGEVKRETGLGHHKQVCCLGMRQRVFLHLFSAAHMYMRHSHKGRVTVQANFEETSRMLREAPLGSTTETTTFSYSSHAILHAMHSLRGNECLQRVKPLAYAQSSHTKIYLTHSLP